MIADKTAFRPARSCSNDVALVGGLGRWRLPARWSWSRWNVSARVVPPGRSRRQDLHGRFAAKEAGCLWPVRGLMFGWCNVDRQRPCSTEVALLSGVLSAVLFHAPNFPVRPARWMGLNGGWTDGLSAGYWTMVYHCPIICMPKGWQTRPSQVGPHMRDDLHRHDTGASPANTPYA
eukprot:363269-Chlamydomonas_euryale.AAC.3